MANAMRVLVFDEPHKFHIEERPTPQPGPGEVRIRIAYVGICGSDLHGYTGQSGRRAPGMVMGHEASGWIELCGDGVEGLPVGTPVTFNPALFCSGTCGHVVENQCEELRVIGVAPEIQGAFADAIVVPAHRIIELGTLSPEWGAAVEPMAIAVHAVHRAVVEPGQSVLVVGGGMIGLCIAQAARLAGADHIVVSEATDERRALAIASGLHAVSPQEVEGLGLFDVSFDAVGVSATASTAISKVRKGGTSCFVGLGHGEITIPLFDVVVAERKIVGTFAYTDATFRVAAEHLRHGRLDLGALIGGIEPFEDIAEAFEMLATQSRHDAKVLMSTGNTQPHDQK